MISFQKNDGGKFIDECAGIIMNAARTAPKARGVDNLEIAYVTGEEKDRLSAKMDEMAAEKGAFFARDAGNLRDSRGVVLIGSKVIPLGLNCAYCGFASCGEKPKDVPCAFNTNDLGIAVGSAVSKAADLRLDNRVLFSAGNAARELGILGEDVKIIFAIPISASKKSPYFDR